MRVDARRLDTRLGGAYARPWWRERAADSLELAGAALLRLAEKLALRATPLRAPELEFYAEAGAPEGALFVDGERWGTLPGVTRL